MTRYFPEVVEAVLANFPDRAVIDGEIIVADTDAQHPRLRGAAAAHPPGREPGQAAGRADAGQLRRLRPARARRRGPDPAAVRRAPRAAGTGARPTPSRRSTSRRPPATTRPARRWFEQFEGAGLDGLIAKAPDADVPARQAGDDQDQAQAHRRLRGRGLPGAQVRATTGSARCCSACTTSAGVLVSVGRHRRLPGRHPQGAVRGAAAAGHHVRRPPVGLGQAARGASAPRARARAAAGTPARTCRSSRCARSAWSRSGTTTWRASGSGTPPSSSAGAPTGSPDTCTYEQLERPVQFNLADVLTP